VALKEQPLTPADLEQYDISIIVVESKAAAEKLIQQLNDGKAIFAQLARKENQDPALRQTAGRMKAFLKVEMLDIGQAIDEQKLLPTQWTRTPVQLDANRWAVVRLERRIPVAEAGLERDRLEATVVAYRVDQWMNRARATASVQKKSLSENVVAVVNGESITRPQLIQRLLEYYGEEMLEQTINRVLLLQSAKEQNVSVTTEEVEKRFGEAKAAFKTPEAYQAFLTRSNLSEKQFRDELRYTALMEKVARRETPITDEDLQRYEVRMIVTPGLAQAQDWIKELNDGGDFKQMAASRSTDDALRPAAGLLRPFIKVEMLDLWRAITEQKLKPGQYTKTPVLLTDNSWVLLKLENILPAKDAPKEERDRLAQILTRYRVDQWLIQARARSKFEKPTPLSAVVNAAG
jgi:foldase protein PrsA